MTRRKIIHCDMDAFFVSIEQRDNPELKGLPVVVGSDEERGVVSTASYEARKYGVHSALSIQVAKRLCPNLLIVPPHFDKYKAVSKQVMAIFHDYSDLVEQLSIDEGFIDVTENKKNIPLAVDIAKEIKQRVKDELNLTISAGVSYNKFLAKIASDYRKPDGLCVIHPDRALDFIAQLPIEKFWGVGRKTADKMHRMGIFSGAELHKCSLRHLKDEFGKAGEVFYNFARGIDERPVETDYVRKSVGCERTFTKDINTRSTIIIELYHTVLELVERINKSEFYGYTLTLKVKFFDFTQITRSVTQGKLLKDKDSILPAAKRLMKQVEYKDRPIRLIGLTVSNQKVEGEQAKPEWLELELEFEDWD